MDVKEPDVLRKPLIVPEKILMGPGPSNSTKEILQAISQPILGHLHDECVKIMDDVKEGIKYIFQTFNNFTLALSGSGHCGMEAIFSNLIEKDEKVLIASNGHWGERATDIAQRYGARVLQLKAPPGDNFTFAEFESALKEYEPTLLFVVHGESSTGVYQPIENLGQLCHKYDCLLAVDAVASLGSTQLLADKWEIDALYTGSQKVLSAPAGITPITFSDRAISKIKARKTKVPVYYFDILKLAEYWGCFGSKPRIYHHTISSSLLCALRVALSQFARNGYENTIYRHIICAQYLYEGLTMLGFEFLVGDPSKRIPTVTTIKIPNNFNWKEFINYIMKKYKIEVSGGLGPTINKVIRIGLMGNNAQLENVKKLLIAFEDGMNHLNHLTQRSKL